MRDALYRKGQGGARGTLIITNDMVTTKDAKHVRRTLKGVLIEERILGVHIAD